MKLLQTRQSSILLIAKGKPGLQCVLKEKVGNGNPNYALKKPKPYVSLCRWQIKEEMPQQRVITALYMCLHKHI